MSFKFTTRATAGACLLLAASLVSADELRNVKPGEPVPAFKLATIDEVPLDSAQSKGMVNVIVYLSAEQRSSELAAVDSIGVLAALKTEPVKLVHVTADAINKSYFLKFRAEHKIEVPLGFDADRTLYHQLGMIVFPTTIITDKDGKLVHVISLRGPEYAKTLEVYVRHALGQLTPEQVKQRLTANDPTESSPRNLASAHRSAARLMREKGRLDAAKEELLKARALDPTDAEVQLDIAELHLMTGSPTEAEQVINELLKVQPEHRRARQVKGICLFREGRLPEAEAMLLESLKLNPEPGRVHYYLGRIYEQQGQTGKALEHYREALRRTLHEPDDVPAPKK